jgi:ribonuclease J
MEKKSYRERPMRGQGITRYRRNQSSDTKSTEKNTTKQNRPTNKPPRGKSSFVRKEQKNVTATERGTLRIIPIGGLEAIGQNCHIYEYGEDIVIVDMGFQFPEEDMPGIDFIIPNLSYLKGKEKNIRAVFITHGHMDHMGAVPYLMPQIGNPPMYAAPLTAGIIEKRQEEFPRAPKLKMIKVDTTKKIPIGKHFVVEPFHVNHNITDAFGLAIHTPVGTIVNTGDFKFDYTPVDDKPANMNRLAQIGAKGVRALMVDSTNADSPGYQISEAEIGVNLEKIVANAKGRVIVGAFASLLTRHQQVIDIAHKYNRKVLLLGRSIHNYVDIATRLKYFNVPKNILIEESDFRKIPDDKLIVICTGAMGQKNAALMRIANNDHRLVQLKKGDTVIFSSSIIPGNEASVQRLQDSLARQGAKVINNQMMDVHTGGHAKREDLKLLMRLMLPEYVIPIHGTHTKLRAQAEIAESVGVEPNKIFVADNGQIIEFNKTKGTLTNKKANTDYIYVDGLGVGDVSHVVLRERQAMAEEGMFVIIATIDGKTGGIIGNPDIISRGFIYMKDHPELLGKVRDKVKRILKDNDPKTPAIDSYLKEKIRNEVGQFLYSQTRRRPMVLPVINEI